MLRYFFIVLLSCMLIACNEKAKMSDCDYYNSIKVGGVDGATFSEIERLFNQKNKNTTDKTNVTSYEVSEGKFITLEFNDQQRVVMKLANFACHQPRS